MDEDLCESIWYQDLFMQQLSFILRQNQDYCTDNECLNLSQFRTPRNAQSSNFLTIFLIIAFVVVMYALRPNSYRRLRNDNTKDQVNGHNSNDEPPSPPPTTQ
ncbi:small integral membrane protein 14 [Augochlora pura]